MENNDSSSKGRRDNSLYVQGDALHNGWNVDLVSVHTWQSFLLSRLRPSSPASFLCVRKSWKIKLRASETKEERKSSSLHACSLNSFTRERAIRETMIFLLICHTMMAITGRRKKLPRHIWGNLFRQTPRDSFLTVPSWALFNSDLCPLSDDLELALSAF
jgi:hypothetical protein